MADVCPVVTRGTTVEIPCRPQNVWLFPIDLDWKRDICKTVDRTPTVIFEVTDCLSFPKHQHQHPTITSTMNSSDVSRTSMQKQRGQNELRYLIGGKRQVFFSTLKDAVALWVCITFICPLLAFVLEHNRVFSNI